MCGRFALTENFKALAAIYGARPALGDVWEGSYNIAPTQLIPVIVDEPEGRELRLMKWGLVPFWAKDSKIGNKMINARAETVREKPGFRDAFKNKRCLVPASGFYEWVKMTKQPYYFAPSKGLFTFAGLWSSWISPESKELETVCIITTRANDVVRPIHDRMPVSLGHNSWSVWTSNATRIAELESLLLPLNGKNMTSKSVSKFVNSVRNNSARCLNSE